MPRTDGDGRARRSRVPRNTLSGAQIVDAAGEMIGGAGLEAFTVPGLARQLGVGVTSIYWYFRTRDELLQAVADEATRGFFDGLDDDEVGVDDDRVLRHFRSYWTRLRSNALWREVFITSFWRTVHLSTEAARRADRIHRRVLGHMMGAGMNLAEATDAYSVLSAYTRGYAMVEHLHRVDVGEADVGGGDDLLDVAAAEVANAHFESGLVALWLGLRLAAGVPVGAEVVAPGR